MQIPEGGAEAAGTARRVFIRPVRTKRGTAMQPADAELLSQSQGLGALLQDWTWYFCHRRCSHLDLVITLHDAAADTKATAIRAKDSTAVFRNFLPVSIYD